MSSEATLAKIQIMGSGLLADMEDRKRIREQAAPIPDYPDTAEGYLAMARDIAHDERNRMMCGWEIRFGLSGMSADKWWGGGLFTRVGGHRQYPELFAYWMCRIRQEVLTPAPLLADPKRPSARRLGFPISPSRRRYKGTPEGYHAAALDNEAYEEREKKTPYWDQVTVGEWRLSRHMGRHTAYRSGPNAPLYRYDWVGTDTTSGFQFESTDAARMVQMMTLADALIAKENDAG